MEVPSPDYDRSAPPGLFAKMVLAMKVVKGLLNGSNHAEILRALDKVK